MTWLAVPLAVATAASTTLGGFVAFRLRKDEDLNPLEEAQGIQRLLDEFSFTHEQAAESVGRSRSA
ncbi:MAG TPA: hypothetical protein VLJ44_02745, partial [Gaiellaceae bacterium]|nr:hypothetical protein [Gaiellaceae bacterium]